MIKEFLEIGQINGTHGVRGEMRLTPWCDTPAFLKGFSHLYFDPSGGGKTKVRSCRPHGNIVLLCLEGVDSVEAAAALRGKVLFIRRSDAKLPAGSYFVAELIGCDVIDADDAEKRYGTLNDVTQTGANDVWHVTADNGREYLLPAIPDVVVETNVEENRIRIRPLKGIFDDAD